MKKRVYLLLIFVYLFMTVSAEDSIKTGFPKFVSFQIAEGIVMPTSRISNRETKTPNVAALTLKYGFGAKGNRWENHYYGMPYGGIGVYKPFYSMSKEMGRPFSVFLFQGAKVREYRSGISLHYEINLGAAFNWNHYDVLNDPMFEALGSSVNAHLGGNLYFSKPLSTFLDLHWGIDVLHFSNGAQRTPNYGINSISAIVELVYKINADKYQTKAKDVYCAPPVFEKRMAHDLSFFITTRTVSLDTVDTNLRSKYPERRFRVVGLNYAYMWHNVRRFMWGPSIELLYDEGNGVVVDGNISERTGLYEEMVHLCKMSDRFSVGLSLKGELAMPGYAVFANLGYNVLHNNKEEERLYQIYGVKVYFTEGLSSSFAVKSNRLTHSKYLYLSVGYTFYKNRKKK